MMNFDLRARQVKLYYMSNGDMNFIEPHTSPVIVGADLFASHVALFSLEACLGRNATASNCSRRGSPHFPRYHVCPTY
jgi:hypothetical protein